MAFALGLAVVGCASAKSPRATQVRAAIETANPACSLEHESRISLGGLKLAVVKKLVRLSGDSEGAKALPHIRRVEIETYRILEPDDCSETSWMEVLGEEMTDRGWWPMVVERDGSDSSWALAHGDEEGDLDGLLVVGFGSDELEIIRVEGRVDRLLAEAVGEVPGEAGRLARLSR